jgi:hypothetical protein
MSKLFGFLSEIFPKGGFFDVNVGFNPPATVGRKRGNPDNLSEADTAEPKASKPALTPPQP